MCIRDRNGTIMTSVESLGDKDGICTYRWTISDNGMGMSKEFLSHIFEPFVQEKNDARSIYQGTGLGMAIVKELINQDVYKRQDYYYDYTCMETLQGLSASELTSTDGRKWRTAYSCLLYTSSGSMEQSG